MASYTNSAAALAMVTAATTSAGWALRVSVEGGCEKSLVVSGDMHVGRVIFQLVEQLDSIRQDWSDFALWWPAKRQWLNRTKMTLDQYGVQADALLTFTRIHKQVRLVMPDQQIVELSVDFSLNLYQTCKQVCKHIGIRHAEELSMLTCPSYNTSASEEASPSSKSKNSNSGTLGRKPGASSYGGGGGTLPNTKPGGQHMQVVVSKDDHSVSSSASTTSTLNNSSSNNSSNDKRGDRSKSISLDDYSSEGGLTAGQRKHILHLSPIIPTQEFLNKFEFKYRSVLDKTRVNSRWLDSSKSLMEQSVKENDFVQLRFKYYAFFDLNVKLDMVRINQIYEQAKWAILNDELDCTEQELITFAALQLHIQLLNKSAYYSLMTSSSSGNGSGDHRLSNRPESVSSYSRSDSNAGYHAKPESIILNPTDYSSPIPDDDDDVDTALSKLEKTLDLMQVDSSESAPIQDERPLSVKSSEELKQARAAAGASFKQTNATSTSESRRRPSLANDQVLAEQLLLMKSARLTFRKLKSYFFVLTSSGQLSYYKSADEVNVKAKPVERLTLKGCEVVPDVNLANRKYGICLKMTGDELNIRCPNEDVYARWMSACKLASKNKPIDVNEPSYSNEVNSILSLLKIQQQQLHSSPPQETPTNGSTNGSIKNESHQLINSSSLSSFKSTGKSIGNGSAKYIDNFEVQPTNLLPARMFKKNKMKQLNDRIMEVYTASISDLDLFDAKLRYIKSWQALPDFGITYFAVRIRGSRYKEEIIGISSNHMIRKNPEGELVKSWPLISMKSWNVNWEIKQFEMSFDDEELVFTCLNCESKILHEFIGGYIFLSLRGSSNGGRNENGGSGSGSGGESSVDDDMFFKLTEKR